MPGIFLDTLSRPLLFFHAVIGFAVVGAVTHLATYSLGLAKGREVWHWRNRLFGLMVPLGFAAAFALGLVLYPAWRIHVRAELLDRVAPHVSALFELKEHLAALSLPLVLAACVLARRPAERELRWMAAPLAILGAALVWAVALLGLYVALVRPVGGL